MSHYSSDLSLHCINNLKRLAFCISIIEIIIKYRFSSLLCGQIHQCGQGADGIFRSPGHRPLRVHRRGSVGVHDLIDY